MTHAALDAIISESAGIVALRDLIRTIAPTKLAALIEGPTGAGKELVAAAIHEESRRRGAFVPFNVCAIGESVFEDALSDMWGGHSLARSRTLRVFFVRPARARHSSMK